jgi:hypothetical protein
MNSGKVWPLVLGLFVGHVVEFGFATTSAAEVLATAVYDTDSYVYFGTNSVKSPEITLGEPPAGDPHYNIGFIEFDVTGLSPTGSKYLQLEPNTATAQGLPSIVRVATLDADIDAYFAIAPNDYAGRVAWLAAHAYASQPIATIGILPSGGKHYADISSTINGWIADPSSNHGLAIWRVGGVDFDSPELFSMNDPLGRGPAINSVPEPQTAVLGVIACLALMGTIVYQRRH